MSYESLLSMAKQLLETELPLPEFIDQLTNYSDEFDVWYSSEAIDESTAVPLLELHNQLIDRAQEVLKSEGVEISKLRLKGKGIKAYTDLLPRRISITKVTKG